MSKSVMGYTYRCRCGEKDAVEWAVDKAEADREMYIRGWEFRKRSEWTCPSCNLDVNLQEQDQWEP